MHGRHRAGGGACGARPLPAGGTHRPARGARGAGAGGDPPPARQRDRAHAGARDRAGGAGAPGRGGARGDRRGYRRVSALFITGTDTGVGKTFVACALTARVAAAAGLVARGFVLSQLTAETDPSAATNAETIAALTGLPCLGVLGHGPTPGDAARALDVAALL